ncbi:cathepsin B-like [Uranotaenia lowii]|uniref:cathepsin B-like n=1 Tax=Uranotaenia lowii TaxID=190385 RepID=UPI00247AC5B8|nr:cathepsin B-like [Uranotaenia lowii]
MLRFVVLAVALCHVSFAQQTSDRAIQKSLTEAVNKNTNQWVAGPYPVPLTFFKTGVKKQNGTKTLPISSSSFLRQAYRDIPEEFDARTQWPKCNSIREVRDQGCCGSAVVVAAVSVMSDRWCVNSPTKDNFNFGEFELLCRKEGREEACNGAELNQPWDYWVKYGIGSGAPYGREGACHSYPFTTCNSTNPREQAPACSNPCQDRRYGRSGYRVAASEDAIKSEIFRFGPVMAVFNVYDDFRAYKSGVYKHVTGEGKGTHVLRIIGWGVEDGVKYWLAANSWGATWGTSGFVKIARGSNECGIESNVFAGLPDYEKHMRSYSSY